MKRTIRRILLAVRDTEQVPAAALAKAAAIARGTGAALELFHVIGEPLLRPRGRRAQQQAPAQVRNQVLAEHRERLVALAASREFAGLDVQCAAEWDFPPYEGIVRRALETGADLVIAQLQKHPLLSRALLAHADWELVRTCPCPLLLVRSRTPYKRPLILAAVDPLHERDKPARLDAAILRLGGELEAALGGVQHSFHAWMPLSLQVPVSAAEPLGGWVSESAEKKYHERTRRTFERVSRAARIAAARQHLVEDILAAPCWSSAAELGAQIVVMGADRAAASRACCSATLRGRSSRTSPATCWS
ncbi:MAG: universal stress protein [Steroidobacteraceae bacterium]